MDSYTVKQIANMLRTNEETVRRWIRTGKLVATKSSKKSGNIVTAAALHQFIQETPKYASVVTSSLTASTVALSAVVGSLMAGLIALVGEKNDTISKTDVESVLKKKIMTHEKAIKSKQAEVERLNKEIEEERKNSEKYRYALENLDLSLIASEINKNK